MATRILPHRINDRSARDALALAERGRRARGRDLWASPRQIEPSTRELLNVPELENVERRAPHGSGVVLASVVGILMWLAIITGFRLSRH